MNIWEIRNKKKLTREDLEKENLLKILLIGRDIRSKKDVKEFLKPNLDHVTPKNLDMSVKDIKKAEKRLKSAKKKNEQIIVFGDYDVDGITGTAILWEVLNSNGFRVMPYIPERIDEGYGLSIKGIDNLLKKYSDTKLIITVDNGIVANEAVDYANKLEIDVIITDHHTPQKKLPKAHAIVHSVKICGSAVAYVFSNELFKIQNSYLELAGMATVSDVMTLTGYNRTILVHGLRELHKTKRIGLEKLLDVAGIDKEEIGVYEIGNMIGPRINAMGRIGSGMDSLRLLCTTDQVRATQLADLLNATNTKRQEMTFSSTDHAREKSSKNKKIIVVADKSYNQGIVGLISGRITEEFYKPSVVISKEKNISKGSARSIKGVNIIELLRGAKDLLVAVGGHPGAAGFSIETKKIPEFKKRLEELADKEINGELLKRKVKIDLELPMEFISMDLYKQIQKLSPFGYGNPEPVFLSRNIEIVSLKFVGKDSKHMKLRLREKNTGKEFDGIYFSFNKDLNLEASNSVDVAYAVSINRWNRDSKLDLKIKDIKMVK